MLTGRGRRQQEYGHGQWQEEEIPEPGSDSTYGVRSLGDSDWGSIHGLATIPTPHEEEFDEQQDQSGSVEVERNQEATPTSHTEPLIPPAEAEHSPASPVITSPQSPNSNTDPDQQLEGYYRHVLDDLSEPSSPASFASMPSYISSLSRTSSLGPDADGRIPYPYPYSLNYTGIGMGMGGSEELVMPTMNFNQSGGSSKEDGRGRGIKVVLLGDEVQAEEFKEGIRGRKEVVELGNERWGFGDVVFTISTASRDDVSPFSVILRKMGYADDRSRLSSRVYMRPLMGHYIRTHHLPCGLKYRSWYLATD